MALIPGSQLGPYTIIEPVGAGGMGEVYRARDSNLKRDVAVKVLPEAFTTDPERLARLMREARSLASLNHPNIAQIHTLAEADGVRAIVMELVDGIDLSARIGGQPMRPADLLPIARQIVEALAAAHDQGIIHRDLKPANIKVRPDGTVKVLDFGLAREADALPTAPPTMPITSRPTPTRHTELTSKGTILGTAGYMSPEQVRGAPLDRRTDVWSFGCVLYECLTGGRAFAGATSLETLAAVLEREPDWASLPPTTPPSLRRLTERCLRKDPGQRLRDIADARLLLEEGIAALPPASRHPGSRVLLAAAGLTAASMMVAVWSIRRAPAAPPEMVRRVQVPAPFLQLPNECTLVISRDGEKLAYVGEREGIRQVFVRALGSPDPKPLPGTDGASCPFFSPDGRSLGFWADRKLKTIALTGGTAVSIYDAPLDPNLGVLPLSASWSLDNRILFASLQAAGRGVVLSVGATGSPPQRLAGARVKEGEYYVYQPELLPDGQTVLFTAAKAGVKADDIDVVIESLRTGERRTLVRGASSAHYVPSGHVFYEQAGRLMAVEFDAKKLASSGPPVTVVEGLSTWAAPWGSDYAVSDYGSLAYLPQFGHGAGNQLVWVDRAGREQSVGGAQRLFMGIQLSPDNLKASTWLADDRQVWVMDLARGVLSRVTTEFQSYWNVWSPDGRHIVFNSVRTDSPGTSLFSQVADGSHPATRLTTTDLLQQPRGFTPDGSLLIFQEQHPETGFDIWGLPMTADGKPVPLLRTRFNEFQPRLSPDGRWLAYVSDESGRDEVYVRPFPAMDQKWQISMDGGLEPAWAKDTPEIFYRTTRSPYLGTTLMAAGVETSGGFRADTPRRLLEGPYDIVPVFGQSYHVATDGRFLMLKFAPAKPPAAIDLVLGVFADLRRRSTEMR